jgi:hypothetical protein
MPSAELRACAERQSPMRAQLPVGALDIIDLAVSRIGWFLSGVLVGISIHLSSAGGPAAGAARACALPLDASRCQVLLAGRDIILIRIRGADGTDSLLAVTPCPADPGGGTGSDHARAWVADMAEDAALPRVPDRRIY